MPSLDVQLEQTVISIEDVKLARVPPDVKWPATLLLVLQGKLSVPCLLRAKRKDGEESNRKRYNPRERELLHGRFSCTRLDLLIETTRNHLDV